MAGPRFALAGKLQEVLVRPYFGPRVAALPQLGPWLASPILCFGSLPQLSIDVHYLTSRSVSLLARDALR